MNQVPVLAPRPAASAISATVVSGLKCSQCSQIFLNKYLLNRHVSKEHLTVKYSWKQKGRRKGPPGKVNDTKNCLGEKNNRIIFAGPLKDLKPCPMTRIIQIKDSALSTQTVLSLALFPKARL